MGWNDRLPEDPYTPPESFYRDRDDYEAWLEYVEMQLERESAGVTSQNLDPQTLSAKSQPEAPTRQNVLSRLWAIIFGQKISKNAGQKNPKSNREKGVDTPF